MYDIHESSESSGMRRRRRRFSLFSFLPGLGAGRGGVSSSLTHEADRLEAMYGEEAVAFVRMQVQAADRKARKRLYRLHDELARRRRNDEPDDGLAGLMA